MSLLSEEILNFYTELCNGSENNANPQIAQRLTSKQLTLITVFTTLIRPHLEYASQVWAPQRIQKIFVKFASNHLNWSDPLNLPPYSGRLKLLNLESLETRRQNADIVSVNFWMFRLTGIT